jgi:molybdate transport system ATP-binding protein
VDEIAVAPGFAGEMTANAPSLAAEICKQLSSSARQDFTLDVRLSLPAGITMVFGPSGSGKTTLLQCIAGLITPDSGRIAVGGATLFDSRERIDVPVARRSVGYVFQELALFPHLTVRQNVEYGLGHLGRRSRDERTRTILESFRVAHLRQAYPRDISGGERQRVALARSLVAAPRVLLLDEPLSSLDAATKHRITDDLASWNEARRIPILYVTHSRREVFALGERVVCLERGRVIAQGAPHDVLNEPRHEIVARLAGFENVFDARVIARHENQGTMTCRLDASEVDLEIPLARVEPGMPVRLAVRAGDILIATSPPAFLSARNVLPGTLVTLRRAGTLMVGTVRCAGATMMVNLTLGACDALALAPGTGVWLVIKTHSCHLVKRGSEVGEEGSGVGDGD